MPNVLHKVKLDTLKILPVGILHWHLKVDKDGYLCITKNAELLRFPNVQKAGVAVDKEGRIMLVKLDKGEG